MEPSKKILIDCANEEREERQFGRKKTFSLQLKLVEEEVNVSAEEEVMNKQEQRCSYLALALSISKVLIE